MIDLLRPDRNEGLLEHLKQLQQTDRLVICEPVYAEVSAGLPPGEEMSAFMRDFSVKLHRTSTASLDLAGSRWREYSQRRTRNISCAGCGNRQSVICNACGRRITTRQHVLADFLIGAHALLQADRLLTRDRGYYATYFPEVELA